MLKCEIDRTLVIATERIDNESPTSLSNLTGLTNNDDNVKDDKDVKDVNEDVNTEECIVNDTKHYTKICTDCGEELTLDKFSVVRKCTYGRRPKCKKCEATRARARRARNKQLLVQMDRTKEKAECTDCFQTQFYTNFPKGDSKLGRLSRCIPCYNRYRKDFKAGCTGCFGLHDPKEQCLKCCARLADVPEGMIHCRGCCQPGIPNVINDIPSHLCQRCDWLQQSVDSCKSNTKKRNLIHKRTQRILHEDPPANLANILHEKLEEQSGRCALVGVELSFVSGHANFASVDRIDDDIGYIPTNIQITMLTANGQFKPDVDTLLEYHKYDGEDTGLPPNHIYKKELKNECCLLRKRCHCDTFELPQKCKIKDLIRNTAKRSAKFNGSPLTHTQARTLIFSTFNKQKGLCYYSDYPLQFGTGAFGLSLERVDINLNYTQENTVLVLAMFNAPARSSEQNWNRPNVQKMLDFQQKKRALQRIVMKFGRWRRFAQTAQVTQTAQKDAELSHDGAKRRKLCQSTLVSGTNTPQCGL
jgi:hypothetical protein